MSLLSASEESEFKRWLSAAASVFPTTISSSTSPYLKHTLSKHALSDSTQSGIASSDTSLDAKEARQQEKDRLKCEKRKETLMKNSPMVKFMLENLERVGCKLESRHFSCTPCDATRAGGFIPEFGVILCQNRFMSRQHMEDTMVHELVHAFDQCTTHINWNNCAQYACAEIRAINLSGECKFTREIGRGFFGLAKHHQACVKRRVLFSLGQVPACQGEGVAQDSLRMVWNSCINDSAPFDEIA